MEADNKWPLKELSLPSLYWTEFYLFICLFFSKIRLNELSLIILIYKNVIYLFACKNYMCFFNCNDEDGRSNAF
jgi:hypothetical protein